MNNSQVLTQNKESWDSVADQWFGTTALPVYGCLIPTEEQLNLFGCVKGKKILDIGCGSGHSLKYHGDREADELWGLDISEKQLENARGFLSQCGYAHRLINSPMEQECGLPKNYFDIVYSVYAIGWATDLEKTFQLVASYLKPGGIFIFSWDHPFMHCVSVTDKGLVFDGSYFEKDLFSFEKGGKPMSLYNRKLSDYINPLAKAGFCIQCLVEETDSETLARDCEFSTKYYSPFKAKKFPLSFVMKAMKV